MYHPTDAIEKSFLFLEKLVIRVNLKTFVGHWFINEYQNHRNEQFNIQILLDDQSEIIYLLTNQNELFSRTRKWRFRKWHIFRKCYEKFNHHHVVRSLKRLLHSLKGATVKGLVFLFYNDWTYDMGLFNLWRYSWNFEFTWHISDTCCKIYSL